MQCARVTVAGAGELVHIASEPASKLRENVTSPGGTTLEALKILMAEDGLQPLLTRAIAAATKRSKELG
jgi:pyrroline-5-carboxylate reductase